MAEYADKRDSQCLPAILKQTISNLSGENVQIQQIAADTAYSSGEALRYCQGQEIDAYIPNFGQYKPKREGFRYNKKKDHYQCLRGNKALLPFKKMDKS